MATFVPYIAAAASVASAGAAVYSATRGQPKTPVPPKPATQDTAANASLQQQQDLMRRRGVLANITGGGYSQPTVAKTMLGN